MDDVAKAGSSSKSAHPLTRSEWALLFVLVAIQFTHMVDFVIIMPLGDRLMAELDIRPAQFSYVVSAYAWAAGIASLLAAAVMDRFDRRAVMLVMYAGFIFSTLFCGLASTYEMLLLSRVLAGIFGGLAAVAIWSVIADVYATEKRGRASGALISSFAVASILGLPIGLALARWYDHRGAPFIALAGLSAIIWLLGWYRLPSVRGHLNAPRPNPFREFADTARDPGHQRAFIFSFFLVLGTFTVASFIGPYYANTNGWKEDRLALIYLVAGICTLISMNLIGHLADRFSRRPLFQLLAFLAMIMALITTHVTDVPLWGAMLILSLFMVFAAGRMVPAQAMLMGAARPESRGSFMSLNTSIQHAATGLAPVIAGLLITRDVNDKLTGFTYVGWVAVLFSLITLVLSRYVRPAEKDGIQIVQPRMPAEQSEPILHPKPAA